PSDAAGHSFFFSLKGKHFTNQLQRSVIPSSLIPLAILHPIPLFVPHPPFNHILFQCLVVYACVLTVLVFNKSEINVFDAQPLCGLHFTPK
uniref:Uncharacterized protein n=1 Tax=Podarcis muralis TaxID=64176 RepID=A0A670K7R1_PODMU